MYVCLIKHHAMKTYGGVEVHFCSFLSLTSYGDEISEQGGVAVMLETYIGQGFGSNLSRDIGWAH
jgi:hypothetical protein